MRLRYAAILLLASVCAFGQKPSTVCPDGQLVGCSEGSRVPVDNRPRCSPALTGTVMEGTVCNGELWVTVKPKPLKCGKYQYIKTDTWVELNDCRPIGNGKLECSPPVPRCEDKLYPMTLAEYEQILERLKKLEKRQQIDGWPAGAGKE
jgi:hypothetical protein